MKKMTKKQVFILYVIIIAVMFVTVFLVNLTIGYSTVKEALVSGGMITAPVALLGAGTGFMILFLGDADDAFENGAEEDDVSKDNFVNIFRSNKSNRKFKNKKGSSKRTSKSYVKRLPFFIKIPD